MSEKAIQSGMTPDSPAGPLFVVGVPRSGTTLLYSLLNQHPQIALMYEADLPLAWPLFLKRRSNLEWLERWNFWNGGLERHQIDTSRIPSDISDTRTATETVCREYARQRGAAIWGDKSPHYYDSLGRVAVQFPTARFVIIWRDLADVCRSVIRAGRVSPFFAKRGTARRVLMGSFKLGIQRDRLLRRGSRVYEILYEDLINNTADEMKKICRFLGVPFDTKMVSLNGADRSAVPPGEHHALARGESILSSRQQPEVLPINLRRKIERYKHSWRQRHGDWPIFLHSPETDVGGPLVLEKLYDQLLCHLLRTWDLIVVLIYCLAPLGLLKAYRAVKGGPYVTWSDYARARTQAKR